MSTNAVIGLCFIVIVVAGVLVAYHIGYAAGRMDRLASTSSRTGRRL